MSEILKRLEAKIETQEAKIEKQETKIERQEAKIERQDAVNKELHSKNEALRRDVSELETKANRTEEAVMTIRDTELLSATGDKAVRDLPYIMMCAYRDVWHDTGIIGYEELTLDYSNCDRPGGGCSSMDIASGTFTAQTGGLYTVTFSGQADLYRGSYLGLYLLHNGIQLKESYSGSVCGTETEHIEEMFSRTLIVSLGVGDTL